MLSLHLPAVLALAWCGPSPPTARATLAPRGASPLRATLAAMCTDETRDEGAWRIDRLRLVKRTLYEQQRCVYARNQPFRLDYKTAAQRPERVRLAWECGRV